MNAIKKTLIALVILFSAYAETANAVTVQIVEGGTVGLTDAGYFSGVVTVDIDGVRYSAMMVDWFSSITDFSGWETDYTPWEGVLYTQDEITDTNVLYSPERYSMISGVLPNCMLGINPADPLWTASCGEMLWNAATDSILWEYANREYPEAGSGITLHDVYLTEIAPFLDPNAVYDFMWVLQTPIPSMKEFVVFREEISSVPVPAAVWLFGSGLLGLMMIARKKQR